MARAVYIGTLGHLGATAPHLDDVGAAARDYRARRLQVHVDLVDAIAAGDEAAVRVAVVRHNATDPG